MGCPVPGLMEAPLNPVRATHLVAATGQLYGRLRAVSRGRCHSSPLLCSTRPRLPFKVLANRRRGWRVMRRPTLNCA